MDNIAVETGTLKGTHFAVLSVTGHEAVNELSDFTAVVTAPRGTVEGHIHGGAEGVEHVLLGARVRLSLGEDPARTERFLIVVEARYEGVIHRTGRALARFQLRLAPSAWVLTQQRRSRIFQHLYMHEIVSRVLALSGIRHRWNLENKYPRRIYCTQFDETDWEYVTRLLAEEGVWFYFEHTETFVPLTPDPVAPGADPRKVVSGALGIAGDALKGLAGAGLGKVGDGLGTLGASALGIASDFVAPEELDPEAEKPTGPFSGSVGARGAGDVLVFVDTHNGYVPSTAAEGDNFPLIVTRRNDADLVGDAYTAHTYTSAGAIRPTQTETRDFDFRRPLVLLRSLADDAHHVVATESGPLPLEVYAHHGEHETPDVDAQNARVLLQQYRARATVRRAVTSCPRLMPGHLFELDNGTNEPVAQGQYAVVRVRHDAVDTTLLPPGASHQSEAVVRAAARAISEAQSAGSGDLSEPDLQALIRRALDKAEAATQPYQNVVEFVRANVPARPPRPRRVPRTVTESATVMGPRGQDVYTDKHGRIKVQFHWDREGSWDENCSCWIRATQPWSGAGFGFQFVPRVGMEVLVTFLAGDPDRPVVIGTLYNGVHETPEPLPVRKTRSVIRTQSVPEGGGFNEIAFEDEKDRERVFVHAQKDYETIVGDARITTVRGEQVTVVGRSDSLAVTADQRHAVGKNQVTLVGADQSANVGGDRYGRVAGNETTYVEGSRFAEVTGVSVESVRGDATSVVQGSRALNTHGDLRVTVGGAADPQAHRLAATFVHGTHATVAHAVSVTANDLLGDPASSVLVLRCGESSIELHPDEIRIVSKKVTVQGSDGVTMGSSESSLAMAGKKATLSADPVEIGTGKAASVKLAGGDAKVHGSKIGLTQDSGSADNTSSEKDSQSKNVHLKFSFGPQEKKTPLSGVNFRVLLARGVASGKTGGDGEVDFHADPDDTTATVQLLPDAGALDKYPGFFPDKTDPVEYLVHIEATTPPASQLPGARFRLRNLGYDASTDLETSEPDRSTTEALLRFQRDAGKPETGELDDETQSALGDNHGG